MSTEIIEYRGQPILKITSDEVKYLKIQFGLKKARLILQSVKAIEEFVENNKE